MVDRFLTHVLARLRHTSVGAVYATLLGVLAVLASAAVFAGISEDVITHDGVAATDPVRLAWVVHHRTAALISGARVLDIAGGVAMVAILAVVVSALLWWGRVPLAAALTPVVAVSGAGALAEILKLAVDRARPPVAYHLVTETNASFPSGHATGSMALGVSTAIVVGVYLLRRPLTRALALAVGVTLPIAVAASRLELGVHWPTDVVAGLALGALSALMVAAAAVWISGLSAGGRVSGLLTARR
jgi:undecaprenyl-diphosphatase